MFSYVFMYGYGKLELKFVHGSAETRSNKIRPRVVNIRGRNCRGK